MAHQAQTAAEREHAAMLRATAEENLRKVSFLSLRKHPLLILSLRCALVCASFLRFLTLFHSRSPSSDSLPSLAPLPFPIPAVPSLSYLCQSSISVIPLNCPLHRVGFLKSSFSTAHLLSHSFSHGRNSYTVPCHERIPVYHSNNRFR